MFCGSPFQNQALYSGILSLPAAGRLNISTCTIELLSTEAGTEHSLDEPFILGFQAALTVNLWTEKEVPVGRWPRHRHPKTGNSRGWPAGFSVLFFSQGRDLATRQDETAALREEWIGLERRALPASRGTVSFFADCDLARVLPAWPSRHPANRATHTHGLLALLDVLAKRGRLGAACVVVVLSHPSISRITVFYSYAHFVFQQAIMGVGVSMSMSSCS